MNKQKNARMWTLTFWVWHLASGSTVNNMKYNVWDIKKAYKAILFWYCEIFITCFSFNNLIQFSLWSPREVIPTNCWIALPLHTLFCLHCHYNITTAHLILKTDYINKGSTRYFEIYYSTQTRLQRQLDDIRESVTGKLII